MWGCLSLGTEGGIALHEGVQDLHRRGPLNRLAPASIPRGVAQYRKHDIDQPSLTDGQSSSVCRADNTYEYELTTINYRWQRTSVFI